MAVIRDDDAERLERIERLTKRLRAEVNQAREESRVVSEQLKADSEAASARAKALRAKALKAKVRSAAAAAAALTRIQTRKRSA